MEFIKKRLTFVLVGVFALLVIAGFFVYEKVIAEPQSDQNIEEIDLAFDPEGVYALLLPRRDGNALSLNLKRTASYDAIKYELAYNSEGIDRGASGEINTEDKKGEYEQEILFGSCSTGGTCVYDKDVENGTLTLHIRKGSKAYRMITQWRLQQPDVALGVLVSGDSHFTYRIDPELNFDLQLINYTIINEATGVPKLPKGKNVTGKVYALNIPLAKTLPPGEVTVELAENPLEGSQIARFEETKNDWVIYETEIKGSVLKASVQGAGIFAVLSPEQTTKS
ncbi:MAG: hypothetical protein C4584_00785 [Armatimonadetes bacterium]|nr:MAG: hypothetical protein C4584_00785 [Armatimonadota bacterium]